MLYKIIKDVYKEIRYLHMNKTKTHENIKLQNILIFNCDKNCNVSAKLTGFKSYVSIIRKGSKGMDYWNAFELVKGQNYSEKCDIYSFGMTLLNYLQPLTFKGVISNEEQEDGTYLKYTTNIQHNTRNLIINCCQIISSKRPDIIKCLKCIQEIRKCNREKSDSKKVEEINVRYSLPQFDILHSVKDVVKSIKKTQVENEFIKALLMLKFGKDTDKVENILKNCSRTTTGGISDYMLACFYLKIKGVKSKKEEICELMLKSAGESHPDAIMYLIDILINIAKEIIPICDDDEKLKIIKTLNDVCKNNQDLKNISFNNTHLNTTDQCETISITYIVTIYGVLKKCFPIVNLHCGFALLYGVGDKINVLNAMPYFYNFQKSSYCNDPQEIEFYQTHCKFTKNNIEDVYEESHEFLDNCILHLEKPNYYSYVSNNKGVLLYKGLGVTRILMRS